MNYELGSGEVGEWGTGELGRKKLPTADRRPPPDGLILSFDAIND